VAGLSSLDSKSLPRDSLRGNFFTSEWVFIFYLRYGDDLTDTVISGKLLVELQIGAHWTLGGPMITQIQLDVDADIQDIPTLAVYLLKRVQELTSELEQRTQTFGVNGVLMLQDRDRYLLGLISGYQELLSSIGYPSE
jgi:hypothetical protein